MSGSHDILNGWCDHRDDDPNLVVSAECRDQVHDECMDCDCGCHDVPEPEETP